VLLDLANKIGNRRVVTPKHYEMMWEREPSFYDEISTAQGGHAPAADLQDLQNKIKGTMDSLVNWSKLNFGSVSREITKLRKDLERLQWNQPGYLDEMICINRRLDELLLREEIK
jgi:hypothetical protein